MGIIKDIDEDNYIIRYLYKTSPESSGCPIINLNNNKVIGINKRGEKEKNCNLGILLKKPLEKFKEEILNHQSNNNIKEINKEEDDEITIIYEINKNQKISDDILKRAKEEHGETVSEKKIFGEKFVENNKNKCKIKIKE